MDRKNLDLLTLKLVGKMWTKYKKIRPLTIQYFFTDLIKLVQAIRCRSDYNLNCMFTIENLICS